MSAGAHFSGGPHVRLGVRRLARQRCIAAISARSWEDSLSGETREDGDIAKRLLNYARNYTSQQLVQEASDALGDPQLGSIVGHLADAMSGVEVGHIYDIGCGQGTLLARLAKLPVFMTRPNWMYCAVDFEEQLDAVHRLAREFRLTSRVDELTPAQLPTESRRNGANVFFCRNVLHELKISETTDLLHSIVRLLHPDDTVLIQDLIRFPEGERNNHCWTSEGLASALIEIGFAEPLIYEQGTPKGNGWLNLRARWGGGDLPDRDAISRAILSARQRQWELWTALERSSSSEIPERDELIEALDVDLQLASLTRELRGVGGLHVKLDPEVERRIRLTEIIKRIEVLAEQEPKAAEPPKPHAYFRERGAQLTDAESFLRSSARLAIVHGGVGTGKTTFLDQLLANRLYDKFLVRIDARVSRGIWPMLEGMMAQLGVNLSASVISVLGELRYEQVSSSVGRVLNAIAPRLVVVIENLDEVLDSNQRFIDPQIETFLTQIVSKDGVKFIVSSRREFLPLSLHRAAGNYPLVSVRMGRFGTSQTVTNVLDDYFDRGKAGLAEYPAALIEAIDNHPLVAGLAGQILAREGRGALLNETLIRQIRNRMRRELVARLVDDAAEASMLVASELRVPVPARVLANIAGSESLHRARENDVIYGVKDRKWGELLAAIGLFRKRAGSDLMPASTSDIEEAGGVSHAHIADQLERVYREDDDPKWIRESYYHRMLAGQTEGLSLTEFAGTYYFTELVASANYSYAHGDYRTALSLYEAASSLGSLDEAPLMRFASSTVRTGNPDGNKAYRALVADYPSNLGIRRSHVDALIWINDYKLAHSLLLDYELSPENNTWNALQWGKVELGLHNYPRAIELFAELRLTRKDDPFIVTYLARALQSFGDLEGAITTLQAGSAEFEDNNAILTSLAQNMERAKRDDEARPLLASLLLEDAGNARAALSMVRVLLRAEEPREADRVAKRAEQKASGALRTFALMARAEVMVAEGHFEVAAEFLRGHVAQDEDVGALIIDALLRAAQSAEDPARRTALIVKAGQVHIAPAMARNVPVQVVLLRLAVAARDRPAFDQAVTNLAKTRIDPMELDRLRSLW